MIVFGWFTAYLYAARGEAFLRLDDVNRATMLADKLDEREEIRVLKIVRDRTASVISMTTHLPNGELLGEVCDAISEIYDVDVSIPNSKFENEGAENFI